MCSLPGAHQQRSSVWYIFFLQKPQNVIGCFFLLLVKLAPCFSDERGGPAVTPKPAKSSRSASNSSPAPAPPSSSSNVFVKFFFSSSFAASAFCSFSRICKARICFCNTSRSLIALEDLVGGSARGSERLFFLIRPPSSTLTSFSAALVAFFSASTNVSKSCSTPPLDPRVRAFFRGGALRSWLSTLSLSDGAQLS